VNTAVSPKEAEAAKDLKDCRKRVSSGCSMKSLMAHGTRLGQRPAAGGRVAAEGQRGAQRLEGVGAAVEGLHPRAVRRREGEHGVGRAKIDADCLHVRLCHVAGRRRFTAICRACLPLIFLSSLPPCPEQAFPVYSGQ